MNRTGLAAATSGVMVLMASFSSPAPAQGTTAPLSLDDCTKSALERDPLSVSLTQLTLDARAGGEATQRHRPRIEAGGAAAKTPSADGVEYREGLRILAEVTDARQSLVTAEAESVRAGFAYRVALPLPGDGVEAQL